MIPHELREISQWVIWRKEQRGEGKPTKVPYQPVNPSVRAASNDRLTWTTHVQAVNAAGREFADGIGFMFSSDDPYCGIDLDHCRDKDTGEIEFWAEQIIARFGTYCELSPSGTGVHLIIKAALKDGRGRKTGPSIPHSIEIYDRGRYFACTGLQLGGTPETIQERQQELDEFIAEHFPLNLVPDAKPLEPSRNGIDVFERARRYLKKMDIAVSGQRGHDRLFAAAMRLAEGFGFSIDESRPLLEAFSSECDPPWGQREIEHKLKQASERVDPSKRGCLIHKDNHFYQPTMPKPEKSLEPATAIAEENEELEPPLVYESPQARLEKHYMAIQSGAWASLPWPWPILDQATLALAPETQTLLCGGEGTSKSLFLRQSITFWHEQGIKVADFELEDNQISHLNRSLAQIAGEANFTNPHWVKREGERAIEIKRQHDQIINEIGNIMTPAPDKQVTHGQLVAWVELQAKAGARILVIDPITAAAQGKEPYNEHAQFILDARAVLRKYGSSLVVVTHPRGGAIRSAPTLDDMAGGRAWPRFSQTVLWMQSQEEKDRKCRQSAQTAYFPVNRIVKILKARASWGSGMDLGFYFDKTTLRFQSQGLIVKETERARA